MLSLIVQAFHSLVVPLKMFQKQQKMHLMASLQI